MKPLSGKKFARMLEQNGWVLRRIHGSHHIYGKDGTDFHFSVHGDNCLRLACSAIVEKSPAFQVRHDPVQATNAPFGNIKIYYVEAP